MECQSLFPSFQDFLQGRSMDFPPACMLQYPQKAQSAGAGFPAGVKKRENRAQRERPTLSAGSFFPASLEQTD